MSFALLHLSSICSRAAVAGLAASLCWGGSAGGEESTLAPYETGPMGMAEAGGVFREEGSNFLVRVALPVIQHTQAATLVQVAGAKGEESLGFLSAGAIQRFRPLGGDWVVGGHAFYEAAQTAGGFGFHQIDFGMELARGRHIVRAHGWVPFSGGETRRSRGELRKESPTIGFDVEYEVDLPSPGWNLQPRVALGYYYFSATDGFSAQESGLKARGELQYRWVTSGVEWREDSRGNGGNWLGTVRVSTAPVRHDLWPRTLSSREQRPMPRERAQEEERKSAPERSDRVAEAVDCCDGAPSVIIYD
jgi:hypothetical protein